MKFLSRVLAFTGWLLLGLGSCGTVDLGELNLSQWQETPDPVTFGNQIHPLLSSNCAASKCHGRSASFSLHPINETQTILSDINNPVDLPEPLRTDYYTVMAYCDLDSEETSELLIWGSGKQSEHPGKKALSPEEYQQILQWLENEGSHP